MRNMRMTHTTENQVQWPNSSQATHFDSTEWALGTNGSVPCRSQRPPFRSEHAHHQYFTWRPPPVDFRQWPYRVVRPLADIRQWP